MSKVIVERPRWKRPGGAGSDYPRGRLANRWRNDFEHAPNREAMGGRLYRDKYSSENLQPLVRYLRKQVGRPWNKVHSEMATHIAFDNPVQQHVLHHVRDYVALHVRIEGKDVLALPPSRARGAPLTSYGMQFRFYVCPRSGILKLAPHWKRKKRHDSNR